VLATFLGPVPRPRAPYSPVHPWFPRPVHPCSRLRAHAQRVARHSGARQGRRGAERSRDRGRSAPLRVGGQTGTPAPRGGVIEPGSGGRDGPPRGRLRGQPEGGEHPPHRVRLRHRAEDPARAPAALTHQHLDREHPAEEPEEPGPGEPPRAPVLRSYESAHAHGAHHVAEGPNPCPRDTSSRKRPSAAVFTTSTVRGSAARAVRVL